MSFMHTTEQVRARTKTITRRLGWEFLKPGDRIRAVEKAQGLKKGEKQKTLAILEVVSVRRESLDCIDDRDVIAEGFPDLSVDEFGEMFCRHMRCEPEDVVTRIEFRYVEAGR